MFGDTEPPDEELFRFALRTAKECCESGMYYGVIRICMPAPMQLLVPEGDALPPPSLPTELVHETVHREGHRMLEELADLRRELSAAQEVFKNIAAPGTVSDGQVRAYAGSTLAMLRGFDNSRARKRMARQSSR